MGTIDVLTEKIYEEGHKEIEKILYDTQTRIDQRHKELNRKKKKWEKETLDFIDGQKREIQHQYNTAHTMEKKRIESKVKEDIISRVEGLLKQNLYNNISGSDYSLILLGWIVEATIGLNEEVAIVKTSEKERGFITDEILRKAEKIVKKEAGLTVILSCSQNSLLSEQGITVSTEDGRVSYNNKISTRLKRYKGSILEIISDDLFREKE